MRPAFLLILFVALTITLPAIPAEKEDPWASVRGLVTFATDAADGLKRARFTGRPPMYFLALRDGPCSKRMGDTVFRDPAIAKTLSRRVVPILIDAKDAKEFREKYRLRGTPQTLFTDLDGNVVRLITGAVSPKRFRTRMTEALTKLGKPKPSEEYLRIKSLSKQMEESLAAERFADATRQMREVLDCGTECEFTERAREVREILGAVARRLLRRAKRLLADDHPKAAEELLSSIPPNFPGLPPSQEAEELLTRLRKRKEEDR